MKNQVTNSSISNTKFKTTSHARETKPMSSPLIMEAQTAPFFAFFKAQFITLTKVMVMVMLLLLSVTSCKDVDPIWDTQKVDESFSNGFPLERFHMMGINNDTIGQKHLVDSLRPTLTKNVINNYPCIKDEKNITFVFGSGTVEKVLSGDGKTYDGKFKNELLIIMNDPCIKDTVFLACGNGMLGQLSFDHRSNWGSAEKFRFTINDKESLAYHLPVLQVWANAAVKMDIPIRNAEGKIVSQSVFTQRLGKYTSTFLRKGDVIDLSASKVFDKNGNVVDFKQRIKDTKNTNERNAKLAAQKAAEEKKANERKKALLKKKANEKKRLSKKDKDKKKNQRSR